MTQFARDLLAHLRQLIVVRTLGEPPDSFTVTAAEPERLRSQAESLSDLTLGRSVDVLSKALADIREGDEPRMTVELALLRCARPQLDAGREALAERIERLEASAGVGGAGPGDPGSDPAPARRAPAAEESGWAVASDVLPGVPDPAPASEAAPAPEPTVKERGGFAGHSGGGWG